MKTEQEWLEDHGYLPPILRDFHDQKDIFKWIWRAVEKARSRVQGNASFPLDGMNEMSAHVFVIDYFLWFMEVERDHRAHEGRGDRNSGRGVREGRGREVSSGLALAAKSRSW